MVDPDEPGSHLWTALDFENALINHSDEVEFKNFNGIGKELHDENDWVMQESNLSLLKHDMVRVGELYQNTHY